MGAGAEITDARLAAYQPVTSRTLRALRRNMRAAAGQTPGGPMNTFFSKVVTDGSGDDGAWADLGTFELTIPGDADGPSGAYLEVGCTVELENNSKAINASAVFRLKIGGSTGSEETILQGSSSSTTSTTKTLTLDAATVTPDAPNTVTVEVKVTLSESSPIGTSTARFKWAPDQHGLIRQV